LAAILYEIETFYLEQICVMFTALKNPRKMSTVQYTCVKHLLGGATAPYSTGSTDYFVLFSCQHRLSGAQIHYMSSTEYSTVDFLVFLLCGRTDGLSKMAAH
jgi:hypothetical protein